MTSPTTQSSCEISQDAEKCVQGIQTPEETLKFKNVPLPLNFEEKMTKGRRIAISTVLVLCNSLLFLSFGSGLGGAFEIGKSFGVYDPTTATWIPAAYPLTHGAFVLTSGRIGGVCGHKNIVLLGGAWWVLWSVINGFCTQSLVTFAIARAFAGIGAAFVMPNVVAIIGLTFPPGRTRNLTLGFLGFGCPVGGALGAFFMGVFIEFAEWRWFFFSMAILGAVLFVALWLVLPPETSVDKEGTVDWVGAFLGICALVLFNFVWKRLCGQAPAVGWSTPYEIALLLVSLLCFAAFGIWVHKFARQPIMPLDIWTAPSFLPLILVVLFSIMSYGICIWYLVAWQQLVRHWSPFHFGIGILPRGLVGGLSAPIAAWLVSRVAAQWILGFGALAVAISGIILTTMPPQQTYWAQVFPATILMALCPDFIFTAAQIIATNSVKRHEQGIAGSLISLLLLYSASLGLGFAGTVESQTNEDGMAIVRGYRGALYVAIGLALAALSLDILFVRVPKDTREGWAEDVAISTAPERADDPSRDEGSSTAAEENVCQEV